jgi:ubiquinone biosynthesis protein
VALHRRRAIKLLPTPGLAHAPVLERTRQIAGVLTRHGLGALADQIGPRRVSPLGSRQEPLPLLTQAERLRIALGELGVTFIKLGQMLSSGADLVPAAFVAELSKLQDTAPTVPIGHIRQVILEDLGAPPEALYARFEPEPLASASIGQVHAAWLPDGRPVVVKVRRPGVVEQVEVDLEILRGMAEWATAHTALGQDFDLGPLVEEFAYTIRNELDYGREAQSAERFRRMFDGDPGVLIPEVIANRSTRRVLTLERVGGIKISDVAALERAGVRRRAVAENAVRILLREVLSFGFFHGDPHPGNFFVQPDGAIAIVDFGMVGRLSDTLQDHLLRAGLGAIRQDAEALAQELYAMGVVGRQARRRAFERDLDHLIGRYSTISIRELSAAALGAELTAIAHRHRLQLPSELALLFRVAAMSEGVGLGLDPEFRFLECASPLVRDHWRSRHSMAATARRLGRAAVEAADLGTDLPRRVGRLLGRVERGELEISVSHEGSRFASELERMVNRLALAVVLAASIVALAVALGARRLPSLEPHLAWLFTLALLFSIAFGAWLLWSMWRSGRTRRQ